MKNFNKLKQIEVNIKILKKYGAIRIDSINSNKFKTLIYLKFFDISKREF